jgi:hypothetical protein
MATKRNYCGATLSNGEAEPCYYTDGDFAEYALDVIRGQDRKTLVSTFWSTSPMEKDKLRERVKNE